MLIPEESTKEIEEIKKAMFKEMMDDLKKADPVMMSNISVPILASWEKMFYAGFDDGVIIGLKRGGEAVKAAYGK